MVVPAARFALLNVCAGTHASKTKTVSVVADEVEGTDHVTVGANPSPERATPVASAGVLRTFSAGVWTTALTGSFGFAAVKVHEPVRDESSGRFS